MVNFFAHVVDNGEVVIGNGGKEEVYLYGNGSDDEALRLSFHTLVSRWIGTTSISRNYRIQMKEYRKLRIRSI